MYKEEILRALDSKEPTEELRKIAFDLNEKGMNQKEIYDMFYEFFLYFQKTHNAENLIVLEDFLDMISGWFVGKNLKFKNRE